MNNKKKNVPLQAITFEEMPSSQNNNYIHKQTYIISNIIIQSIDNKKIYNHLECIHFRAA